MNGRITQQISDFVDQQARNQLRFLIDLCNLNSYSFNKKGVDGVADLIIEHLGGVLPDHRVFEQSEVGNCHLLRNGRDSGWIYLVGHLDTVFPPAHPFQKCRIEDDTLYGPGTADMKGGIAVMTYAILALAHMKLLDRLNIALILNSDEEIGSRFSRELFLRERTNTAVCLVAECSGPAGEIVISRNGKLGAELDCHGRDRHVSCGSHDKSSAILELAQKIIALEALNGILPGASINVGKIEGGLGPATIPSHANCLFDVRWTDEAHREILQTKIEKIIAEPYQAHARSEMRIMNSRPAMPRTAENELLLQTLQQVGKTLGMEIKPEHRRGTSDANFFGTAGIPTLDGFGPIGGEDHTANEFVRISSLKERTALLTLFLAELGRDSEMPVERSRRT